MIHPRRIRGISNVFYIAFHRNSPHCILLVDTHEGSLRARLLAVGVRLLEGQTSIFACPRILTYCSGLEVLRF